jgi:hypothetical protein
MLGAGYQIKAVNVNTGMLGNGYQSSAVKVQH